MARRLTPDFGTDRLPTTVAVLAVMCLLCGALAALAEDAEAPLPTVASGSSDPARTASSTPRLAGSHGVRVVIRDYNDLDRQSH